MTSVPLGSSVVVVVGGSVVVVVGGSVDVVLVVGGSVEVVVASADSCRVVGTEVSAPAHHEKERPPMRIPPVNTMENLRNREVTGRHQGICE